MKRLFSLDKLSSCQLDMFQCSTIPIYIYISNCSRKARDVNHEICNIFTYRRLIG